MLVVSRVLNIPNGNNILNMELGVFFWRILNILNLYL